MGAACFFHNFTIIFTSEHFLKAHEFYIRAREYDGWEVVKLDESQSTPDNWQMGRIYAENTYVKHRGKTYQSRGKLNLSEPGAWFPRLFVQFFEEQALVEWIMEAIMQCLLVFEVYMMTSGILTTFFAA